MHLYRPIILALVVAFAEVNAAAADEGDDELRVDDEVVEVIGVRQEIDPLETSAAVTTIPVDERLRASAELADVVGASAGVHLQRLGGLGNYSVVSIRGSSARQVEVFVDGVPLNPHGSAPVNLAELSLDAFERIDVYRQVCRAADIEGIRIVARGMRDRFGPPPVPVQNLLLEAEIRIMAEEAGVDAVQLQDGRLHLTLKDAERFAAYFAEAAMKPRVVRGEIAVIDAKFLDDARGVGQFVRDLFARS